MSLAVAIQMDPIDTINIDADSTFALALEGQARGHALFHYLPQALTLRDGRLFARGRKLEVFRRHGNHHRFGDFEELDLAAFDIVLMRQDPPFDMAYITATHMLERIHPETLVVNDPFEVRNAPEKLFVLDFPELMPPTLISRDKAEIEAFRLEHGTVAMKPLHGHGGAAVFKVTEKDPNFGSMFDLFATTFREAWVVQRYLDRVTEGDKRIILVDGVPMGAVNRVPAANDIRSNMVRGGAASASELTEREREICATIGPELARRGLILVGIDVIDGHLTEINVTSPTGIRAIQRLGGPDLSVAVWDAIEARVAARKGV
jgi:glutathione synthase